MEAMNWVYCMMFIVTAHKLHSYSFLMSRYKEVLDIGWWSDLSEKGLHNIEDILAAKGENVRRIANESDRVEISDQLEIVPK